MAPARLAAALLAVALVVLSPRPLRAAEGRHVEVVTVGAGSDAALVEDVIGELLFRLDVELAAERDTVFDLREVVTSRAEDARLIARLWIDLRGPRVATVYLVDRAWERVLVRDVPLEGAHDEVAREQLGHIVQAAVETLLAGGTVGRPREEVRQQLGLPAKRLRAPRPAPAPEEHPATTQDVAPVSSAELALAGYWEVQGLSGDAPVAHGPGLRLELSFLDGAWRPGGAFALGYRLPVITEGSLIDARLDTLAIRARAQTAFVADEHWRLVGALGGGYDAVHIDPRSDEPRVTLAPSRFTWVPFLGASLAARWHPLEPLAVELGVGIEGSLVDSVYLITQRGRRQVVLDPWSLRPLGTLGLVWLP